MNAFTSLFKAEGDMLEGTPQIPCSAAESKRRTAFCIFRDELLPMPDVDREHIIHELFHALYPNNPHQYAQALERRLAMEEK